ncbi:hypothetical protein HT031_001873 [Scenedesmus sp. PABB004]|nr:hypothetical protein HT031_001873 [Scenedesmus sp. PABB004]
MPGQDREAAPAASHPGDRDVAASAARDTGGRSASPFKLPAGAGAAAASPATQPRGDVRPWRPDALAPPPPPGSEPGAASVSPGGVPRGWAAMLPSPKEPEGEAGGSVFAGTPPASPGAGGGGDLGGVGLLGGSPARAGRPAPLLVPAPVPGGPPSSRLAHAAPAEPAAPAPRPGLPRPPLLIPPGSPRDAGCATPPAASPGGGLVRPYSGPTLAADQLDLDAIDDVPPAPGCASPVLSAPGGGGGGGGRAGGPRSSRDHVDLRRAALMNHMLSPRPAPLSVSAAGAAAGLFTGDTRARGLPSGAAGGAAAAASGGSGAGSAAASPLRGGAGGEDAGDALAALLGRGSRGGSPAAPSLPSILAGGGRSQPPTPTAGLARLAAGSAPGSSRGSSVTASPVPPPTHGAAAALLAGSVVASPHTPCSPLSALFSPRSVAAAGSGCGSPLPPPLFAAGGSAGAGFGAALPGPAALAGPGSAGSPRSAPGSARVWEVDPTLPNVPAVRPGWGPQLLLQQQQQDAAAAPPTEPQPQHLQQRLRQQLQLHDTRLGPHGESPLSPSHHHSALAADGGAQPGATPATLSVAGAAPAGGAAAAPDAPAGAPGGAVGVAGRRGVHEWLDQHSWLYPYELPPGLRDAADVARSQGLSITSPVAAGPGLARAGADAGVPGWAAAGAGASGGGGDGLDEAALGQLGARLERFRLPDGGGGGRGDERWPLQRGSAPDGPGSPGSSAPSSRPGSASRLSDAAPHSLSRFRLEGEASGSLSRPGSALGSSRAQSRRYTPRPTSRADSAADGGGGEPQHAVAVLLQAAAAAAAAGGGAPSPGLAAGGSEPGGAGSGASTPARGGSARLLSPGSHRYTAGNPVVHDSCCCSCGPASPPPAAPALAQPGSSSGSSAVVAAAPAAVSSPASVSSQPATVQLPQLRLDGSDDPPLVAQPPTCRLVPSADGAPQQLQQPAAAAALQAVAGGGVGAAGLAGRRMHEALAALLRDDRSLARLLASLPGVDPHSAEVRRAVAALHDALGL